ncbi:MAG: hypothetical protein HOI35_06995, partial [Woeseia sp.]|nr:hypothetical protein [Woeseia sp.]
MNNSNSSERNAADRPIAIAAAIAIGTVAVAVFNVQPMYIGALADHLGFSAGQLGLIAGVEVAGVDLPPELSAGGGHDLFVYNLPALRLRKGERAAVPIFTSTAPYRDVHTWDLHYTRADVATSPSGSG